MRLRNELARALRSSPLETIDALRIFVERRRVADASLKTWGLDEALSRLDASRVAHANRISPILVMRLGEALSHRTRTCLDRALARYAYLTAIGVPADFVIGLDASLTGQHQGDALGHAWVEVQGEPWPPEDVQRYRASYRHPSWRSLSSSRPSQA